MNGRIAIVGMACEYADARSPAQLWESVLARRRAFRRLPPERLRIEDYYSEDPDAPDRTYAVQAALIEGFEFDRVGFRVSGEAFRSADPAHWLALDVASRALADAGFEGGAGLPRETTGVFLGNTLTGESSRADVLRLRWPYVRRQVDAALAAEGWPGVQRAAFLDDLEGRYKGPFPPVGAETLAGGLSNTIAGRICNSFDLQGGGFTIDAACASSLLAVVQACSALASGDLDVALAGGVDLSLDPFELVGFAKAGALAREEMRVFDARSAGFWPGEGAGFVVLMRHDEAEARGLPVVATVAGWGVASDGSGGLTRPEVKGQLLAIRRAYRRAGFGIETVSYFEGHGTGTAVGDSVELQALTRARREADPDAPAAVVGSIKANIGHTKAAAGIAGLIKAALVLRHGIIPPNTACDVPHPALQGERPALRIARDGEPWPAGWPRRAGVGALGFGGIDVHVVLDRPAEPVPRTASGPLPDLLLASSQDAELFFLSGRDAEDLRDRVEALLGIVPGLSLAELADLAAHLAGEPDDRRLRAAVVASRPVELASRLEGLRSWLVAGTPQLSTDSGVFLGRGGSQPRIGFLFPGQGTPIVPDGGALRRRFGFVADLFEGSDEPQSALIAATLSGLRVLERLGIDAAIAVGHSLGELAALCWAGTLDEAAARRIARARGLAIARLGGPAGGMVAIQAGPEEVEDLVNGDPVAIAALNSPKQTVISGDLTALKRVLEKARASGLAARRLPVTRAFHSAMVAGAARPLAEALAVEELLPIARAVVSTVSGSRLTPDVDLRWLLGRQLTEPVRFAEALAEASQGLDLWLEVGPGRTLGGLAAESTDVPILSIDTTGPTLRGLLSAVGAAYALGSDLRRAALFEGRFTRPFDPNRRPRFFANPCELAPVSEAESPEPRERARPQALAIDPAADSPLGLVRRLVAEASELPIEVIREGSRLLDDLNLNSITVGRIVAEAATRLGLAPPLDPTGFADATVSEIVEALAQLREHCEARPVVEDGRLPAGVDSWIRAFTIERVERPRGGRPSTSGVGSWRVFAADGDPLALELEARLPRARGGRNVLACLPTDPDERQLPILLGAARAVLDGQGVDCFALVQREGGASSWARSIFLEGPPGLTACVVAVPAEHPESVAWVLDEIAAASGFVEACYDPEGRRTEPVLRLLDDADGETPAPLGPDDVLLVTAGGKGIAAEASLALAKASGARIALLGRSSPTADAELTANLRRMERAGMRPRYVEADVTDPSSVRSAIAAIEADLGPLTAILHAAGTNVPRRLDALDEDEILRTLAPKVQGARNLLAALPPDRPRLFVAFGSIIARTGMRGEAHYALANEWLTRLVERLRVERPTCRALALEWSVWAEAGMGARLGRVEALRREGITPIPTDLGVAILGDLIGRRSTPTALVVAGRFGEAPTLRVERGDLPFLRFLERPRVVFPGVEVVSEADLSGDQDPYLDDHVYRGQRLLPAVIGLEAMAQAAISAVGGPDRPIGLEFENLRFDRPVIVNEGGRETIRVAALVRGEGRVDVALRSESSGFQADHFRATCLIGRRPPVLEIQQTFGVEEMPVAIEPRRDLYGTVLFQGGRFRRLRRYRRLGARECVAEVGPEDPGTGWFGRLQPDGLLLGDPAARDAALHAVQACIPHAIILPIGVDRLILGSTAPDGPRTVHARERAQDGQTLIYDLEIADQDGHVRERWEGLRLRIVESRPPSPTWPAPFWGPYLERRAREAIPGASVQVAVERGPADDRRSRSDRVIGRALGRPVEVSRRPDGRPEVPGDRAVSVSHAGAWTLGVAGPAPIACDLERVSGQVAGHWEGLLDDDRRALAARIAAEAGEPLATAATRVWVAIECLKKAQALIGAPLTLRSSGPAVGVLLAAGEAVIATFPVLDDEAELPLIAGILARPPHERL